MNWLLLQNSLFVAGGTTALSLILGGGAALVAVSLNRAYGRALLGAAVIALALPPFLVTNSWMELTGQAGAWKAWLPFNLYSLMGTVWILTLLYWPIPLFFTFAALRRLQPSQLEVEPALRHWKLVRWLILPAARAGLLQGAVLTFVLAWNNFSVPALLQTKVFPAELWVSFNTTFDYLSALTLSAPLLALSLILLVWLGRRDVSWPRSGGEVPPGLFRQRVGWALFLPAMLVTSGALVLSVGVPLGQLLASSRTWKELPSAFAAGHSALRNSILFAAVAASLSLLAGLSLSASELGHRPLRFPLFSGSAARNWADFSTQPRAPGCRLSEFRCRSSRDTVRYAALSWSGIGQAMRTVDRTLVDFAKLHSNARWPLLRHAYWPQIAPEARVLWIVTYLLCLWDVETLVLIIPPGCETLALRIFNLPPLRPQRPGRRALCLAARCGGPPLGGLGQCRAEVERAWGLASPCSLGFSPACTPAANEVAAHSPSSAKFKSSARAARRLGQFNKPRSVAVDSRTISMSST